MLRRGTIAESAPAYGYPPVAYRWGPVRIKPRSVGSGGGADWRTAAREPSRTGDYGKVIALAREDARLTQKQLGQACGLSQSAVSRLEKRGVAPYTVDLLARVAAHLSIPPYVVGLGDSRTAPQETDPVDRREFLGGVAAAAATPLLTALPPAQHDHPQAAALRLSTSAYRRLDGSTPSRDLTEPVHAHMRLIQTISTTAQPSERGRLAAVGSEAASLAGWLAWDMGDHGSARTWYGSAIKAAKSAGNQLLTAYQSGSLAQLEAHAGNGAQALSLVHGARRALGAQRPAIADAWLSSVEALAHAASGDERAADQALSHSRAAADRLRWRSRRRGRGCSRSMSPRWPRAGSPAGPGSAWPHGCSRPTPMPWRPATPTSARSWSWTSPPGTWRPDASTPRSPWPPARWTPASATARAGSWTAPAHCAASSPAPRPRKSCGSSTNACTPSTCRRSLLCVWGSPATVD